jgi:hypothetical protein
MRKKWNINEPDGFFHYWDDLQKEPRIMKQRNLTMENTRKTQNFGVLHLPTVSPENFFSGAIQYYIVNSKIWQLLFSLEVYWGQQQIEVYWGLTTNA